MADAEATVEAGQQPYGQWDEQTDFFVNDIEPLIQQKFSISLRQLLARPDSFAKNKPAIAALPEIRKTINSYFDDAVSDFSAEKGQLEKDLQRLDSSYKKIDEVISGKTSLARVPYIRPVAVNYNTDEQEEIVIDQYNGSTDVLLSKMINSSNYVANLSSAYKAYNIGAWLFSGQRDYIISFSAPTSPIMVIENGRDIIAALLDAAATRLSSL